MMHLSVNVRYREYVLSLLLVVGTTFLLWLLRTMLTPANISIIYLLVVMIAAIWWGTGPSMAAAVSSFLCFNFFLIEPLYTFRIADPRHLIELVVFLISAALIGQLASFARQKAEDAIQRTREMNFLYELTSEFNQLSDTDAIYQALRKLIMRLPTVRAVYLFRPSFPLPIESPLTLHCRLHVGNEFYGMVRIEFAKPPSTSLVQLVKTSCEQGAIALQRIELTERAQKSKTFEEADQLKTAILHSVSHDLRTPITIIKTSASNLLTLRHSLSDVERIEMLQAVENAADHLNKMVGHLLDLSRLNAGVLQINTAWNSLEEVAGDIAARVWQFTHEERIKIHFPDGMPLVQFDYGLILQAMSNLVENSLRYEPSDQKVEISARVLPSEVQVLVLNHGPNLPQEERETVMEPFYHGQNGNTGLGLAIAQGIINVHHGKLWIEDTPGGGVTFVFSLALTPVPESKQEDHENFGG